MPDNIALYILLVVAVGIGYLLGRRERRAEPRRLGLIGEDPVRGLKEVLDDHHDQPIDALVEGMAVDGGSVNTHLLLGALMRRRGEVDRAIRIHQNLLARPVLSAEHRTQTELELARDYLSAGLLGRAESLLKELAARGGGQKHQARLLLLDVYQRERDWERAIAVGRLLVRGNRRLKPDLAQFQCEIAEQALARGDQEAARAAVSRALGFDGHCVRASLIAARIAFEQGRYRASRRHLNRVRELDPGLVDETLDLARSLFETIGDRKGWLRYLEKCLARRVSLPVVMELAAVVEEREGSEAARDFLTDRLSGVPSLKALAALIERFQDGEAGLPAERLAHIREMVIRLSERESGYRCGNCGFSCQSLMWHCPSCQAWDSIRPVDPATDPGS